MQANADSNESSILFEFSGKINTAQTPIRAMWITNDVLYSSGGVRTSEQAIAFLDSIGNPDYVYVRPAYVAHGNPSVTVTMTINFATLVHSVSNKTKVLASIDIITDDPSSNTYCDLSNQANRDTLITSMSQFINNYGFDGAIFDIEPLESGTTWLPVMIQQLKSLTDKPVIVYSFKIVDQGFGYGWTASYLQSVASAADYVEISLYDYGCKTISAYQDKVLDQISRVQTAGLISQALFVLPAFPDDLNPTYHNSMIENIAIAGPLVQTHNTGLFSQEFMTQNEYEQYLTLFAD